MLDSLAQRWGCPPWVIEQGPAEYLAVARIADMAKPEGGVSGG